MLSHTESPYASAVAVLLVILFVISLPGMGLTYIGWYATRALAPGLGRNLLRATFIAVFLTPTIYGHAGPMPAYMALAIGDKEMRPVALIPMLIVWIVAFGILQMYSTILARARQARD